jgi:hypothetical protein
MTNLDHFNVHVIFQKLKQKYHKKSLSIIIDPKVRNIDHFNDQAFFMFQGLIDLCLEQIESVLPAYLKAPLDSNSNTPVSPDSTSNSSSIIKSVTVITQQQQQHQHQSAVSEVSSSSMSPDPDLACAELLSNESIDLEVDESGYFGANQAFKTRTVSGASSYGSRSSSPLSAVDIFTDFSTNVLQKAYAEVEADGVDPTYSILCS